MLTDLSEHGRSAQVCDREGSVYSQILHEFPHSDVQRISDQLESAQRHALLSAFEPVEMCSVQSGKLCKLFLRDALLFADLLDSLRNHALDVVLQSIRL